MVFLVLLSIVAAAPLPGILFGFTPNSVNHILQDFLPEFEYSIKSLIFPEITIPVFSNTGMASNVELEHLKVTSVYIDNGNSGLFITPARDLQFVIPDMSLSLKFIWTILSKEKVIKSGNGKINISKASLGVLLKPEKTKDSHFNIKKSEFKIEKLEVIFDEPSGLYNWILEAANRKMKNILESSATDVLTGFVTKLVKGSKNLPLNEPVQLSLALIENPVVESNLIKLYIDGTGKVKGKDYVFNIENKADLKYTSKKDFGLYISEYSVNTVLLAEHVLNPITISSEDLVQNITTDILEPIFEDITKAFGQSKESKIHCSASTSPQVSLKSDSVQGRMSFLCSVFVETKKVVDLDISLSSRLSIKLSRGSIFTNIEECKVELIKANNSILPKEVPIDGLKNLLNFSLSLWKDLISQLILPEGMPLPAFFSTFVKDSFIEVENSFIKIEGNTYFPIS